MTTGGRLEICVVGAGPRGLSVLERLCANARHDFTTTPVIVHMVDPAEPGAGSVWRTSQSRHLLMNTVASQISVFTDASSRIDGTVEPGPSLYEWIRGLAVLSEFGDYDDETVAEAAALGPDDYPSRALYGRYLIDAFRRIVAAAPAHVTVNVHRSRVLAMADTHGVPGGPQGVRLEDGTRLNRLDAIIMAQGHVPARLTAREARTASLARIHYLSYVTPANPADVDLSGAQPGQDVLVRGLGLNFFDYLTLLTTGRGGVFRRIGGRLRYEPSGAEPRLAAFSRRGVPYHARGENQKGAYGRYHPRLLTPGHIAQLRRSGIDRKMIDFQRDLWPLISREVEGVYYATLLERRGRGADCEEFLGSFLHAPADTLDALLTAWDITGADRWSWERLATPYQGQSFTDRAHFQSWLLDHLAADVREARLGNVRGPLKAALDVLRDLRNEVRLAVDHGGLDGDSYRDFLAGWYTPLNAFLSIGPPSQRIEEMMALIEAGILTVLGPGVQVRIDTSTPAFIAESTVVPGPPVRATAFIEARLPDPDLRRTDDPLLRHLLDTDQISCYHIPGTRGGGYHTGGLAVTERPYRVVDARGRAHPRRFAYGVPTESVHWVTAAGIRPGVDSVTLADSDAIARAALALKPVSAAETGDRKAAAKLSREWVII